MNYTTPTIVNTGTISKQVQDSDSSKAEFRVVDNPITQSLGTGPAYEADE